MKQEFLDFLNSLMEAAPEVAAQLMTDNIRNYIDALSNTTADAKPEITDNGKQILKFLQDNPDTPVFKAKDIAEGLFTSSRAVSGSLRKLVADNFVDKIGQNPALYSITEKGKNYNID